MVMIWLRTLVVLAAILKITSSVPLLESSDAVTTETERDRVLRDLTMELLQYIDDSIDPCDDFYAYVCNNLQKHHPIPSHRSTVTVDSLIADRIERATKEFVTAPPIGDPNDAGTKVKQLYRVCLDTEKRNEIGVQPLLEFINDMGGWHALNESVNCENYNWLELLGRMGELGLTPIINLSFTIDYEKPDKYVLELSEDDAMSPIPRSTALSDSMMVDSFKKYVIAILLATGMSEETAVDVAEDILTFSMELTRLTIDEETVKDQKDINKRVTVRELQTDFPSIDWFYLFERVYQTAIDPEQIAIVLSTPYYSQLPELLQKTPTKTIVNYLFWRVLQFLSGALNEEFDEISLQFMNTIFGIKTRTSREEECLQMAEGSIARPVQAFFIKNFFDEESKTAATEMTNRIRNSFRELIANKEWLDTETREAAIEKLDNMRFLIGYPEELASDEYVNDKYKDLHILDDNYFQTTLNFRLQHHVNMNSYLNKTTEKNEWLKSPTEVNAFFSPMLNLILLPAGNLQPSFYHRYYPEAANYGAMGTIIGHEMTHGFDKNGRDYDSQGRRMESWTTDSASSFDAKTECFVEQYGQFRKFNISHRGRATQNENIADSGGIRLAYNAYLAWVEENQPNENLVLPGIDATDKQLFFIAYAHSWCEAKTDSETMRSMLSDSHSPSEFRVRGSLSNMAEFSEVFNCPTGSPMNPEKKCGIW